MKHGKTVISLSLAVSAVPFMGLPSSWKNIIFAALGIVIALLVYKMMHYHASVQQTEMEEKGNSEEDLAEESEEEPEHPYGETEAPAESIESEEYDEEQKDESVKDTIQDESQKVENEEELEDDESNEDDDEHTHQSHE